VGDCPGRPDQALIHVTVGFTMAAVFGIRLPRGGR